MKRFATARALRRLGTTQTLRGAIIIGLLAGLIAAVQGIGYASAYPDQQSRAGFAASLQSVPALGILYGETKNLHTPEGYMVYRAVPVMALIAAVWSLMTTTRLLRGQEEDGLWEQLAAGTTTARHVTWWLFAGYIKSLCIAAALTFLIAWGIALSGTVTPTATDSALITAAMFLPAVLFGAVGIFVSQLAASRRRTLMYGLVLLLVLFGLRALGNTLPDLYWLKYITPFGWTDLISPVADVRAGWIALFTAATGMVMAAGIFASGKRDLQTGLLPESVHARPRYYLLGSSLRFALRQTLPLFAAWGIVAVAVNALLIAVATVAAESITDSASFQRFIGQTGGSLADLKIAFMGISLFFTAAVLLIMTAASIARIHSDEARGHLDTIFAHPGRRGLWLAGRAIISFVAASIIALCCAVVTYVLAGTQDISLDMSATLAANLSLLSVVTLTLGAGIALYGFWPRWTVIGVYTLITWSFLVDTIGAVVTLDGWLRQSSLFHYVPLSLTTTPDGATFIWLGLAGIGLATIGIYRFSQRDIIPQ